MTSNIERFKADLKKLINNGNMLQLAMQLECNTEVFKEQLKKQLQEKTEDYIKKIPSFNHKYQLWYSESLVFLRQILPDRVQDFIRHYEKQKARKEINYENYKIEDYLQGITVTRGLNNETIVGKDAAIPHFNQQLAIVNAAQSRFESTLFDIRHIVQADLMDSELESAEHLNKSKYFRAAGAIAGVVLERHLGQVCIDHKITITKKIPQLMILMKH